LDKRLFGASTTIQLGYLKLKYIGRYMTGLAGPKGKALKLYILQNEEYNGENGTRERITVIRAPVHTKHLTEKGNIMLGSV